MKKLEKLQLKNVIRMDEDEMKMIVGGSGQELTESQKKCEGQSLCASCIARVNNIGQEVRGHCSQNAWSAYRYCFDGTCHY
ncbi:rSAM-modified peptide [Dysgonomonas capnocytophagoides]|uniref:RSAM-modified peptide n=1 Tax=Dysgonomonas capnocytophagoides TaxID=45254 RepID=A0A4Y8L8N4_9BACT|nr:TIGR04149 family rSAM-modified RiPP [Dysgonomonas capnocytophagoides]TFD97842.1 rSAM-modified peptide [Dysgonomonas capnocytophagoides]